MNFWYGTIIGFVSGLAGAAVMSWMQYRLRIREHEYKRKQDAEDRKKEQRENEEAEREAIIASLSDIYGSAEYRDRLRRTLGAGAYDDTYGFRDSLGLRAMFNIGHDREVRERLRTRNLFDLKLLHSTVIDIISHGAIETAEREAIISVLRNIHRDHETLDRVRQTLESYLDRHKNNYAADSLLRWSQDSFSANALLQMNLSELKLLYGIVVNIVGMLPAAEVLDRRIQ